MLKNLLSISRFLLVLPVIGSLLLTVGVVVMGFGVIIVDGWELFQQGEFSAKAAKLMTITVIETIDLFLVGALGYITAVGFYKLFISQEEVLILKRIRIEKLADLENKIIGVIIAASAVSFLGDAVEAQDPINIFYAGAGIALLIGALVLFMKMTEPKEKGDS